MQVPHPVRLHLVGQQIWPMDPLRRETDQYGSDRHRQQIASVVQHQVEDELRRVLISTSKPFIGSRQCVQRLRAPRVIIP